MPFQAPIVVVHYPVSAAVSPDVTIVALCATATAATPVPAVVESIVSPLVSATASAVGSSDAQTVLLLHGDGADASTTFLDSSGSVHSVTANGSAQVDTAQSVFGGASVLFGGGTDALVTADSVDWTFGSGDFTVDFRVRFNSIAANYNMLLSQQGVTDLGFRVFYYQPNGRLYLEYSLDGPTVTQVFQSWAPSTATWYHIAVVRTGNNCKLFVDGTQLGTDTALTGTLWNAAQPLYIGNDALGLPLNGWMDEIRISKGIARWTANFTPPTSAYGGTPIVIETIVSPLVTATAQAIVPTLVTPATTTVVAPVATASAAAQVPVIIETVLGVAATATASALAPVIRETVVAPLATATAAAQAPVIEERIVAPIATATAAALVPVLVVAGTTTLVAPVAVSYAQAGDGYGTGFYGIDPYGGSTPLVVETVVSVLATATADALVPTLVFSPPGITLVAPIATATATAAGTSDAQTVLLLHADGTDTSTTFPDSSQYIHAVTANGSAQVDTAQSVFGGASALFGGGTDGLVTADSADWTFGAGDFTVDMRVQFNSIAATYNMLLSQQGVGDLGFRVFYYQPNGRLYFEYSLDGPTVSQIFQSWSPSTATWYHIAVVRTGNVCKLFVDGTQLGTDTALTGTLWDASQPLYIGNDALGFPLNGWMDEVRISKGVARWTNSFVPPTQPYSSGSAPVIIETVVSPLATATAGAVVPTIIGAGSVTVAAAVAVASTAAAAPLVLERIVSPLATATAGAVVPVIRETIVSPLVTATAAAAVPSLAFGSSLVIPVARATAQAFPPVFTTLVLDPVVCGVLTLSAVTCGTLTLSTFSPGSLVLSSASDSTLALSGQGDASLTLTESVTVT